jgi:hypothetical protein
MPVEVTIIITTSLLVIITLLVSWLVLILLIRVVKASIIAAIGIGAIVLVLQLVFGISPFELWQYITQGFQTLLRVVTGR